MGREFVYTQPVKIIFGEGKFAMLGSLLEELGVKKCVIACGRHFAPTALAMQEEDSRIAAVYGGVEQNPQLSGAIETARLAREVKADAVVGVGRDGGLYGVAVPCSVGTDDLQLELLGILAGEGEFDLRPAGVVRPDLAVGSVVQTDRPLRGVLRIGSSYD